MVKRRSSVAAASGVHHDASRSIAATRVAASPCVWVACFKARWICRSEGPDSVENSLAKKLISSQQFPCKSFQPLCNRPNYILHQVPGVETRNAAYNMPLWKNEICLTKRMKRYPPLFTAQSAGPPWNTPSSGAEEPRRPAFPRAPTNGIGQNSKKRGTIGYAWMTSCAAKILAAAKPSKSLACRPWFLIRRLTAVWSIRARILPAP